MRLSAPAAAALALLQVRGSLGHPGMAGTLEEILVRARAGPDAGDSDELIGDLVGLPDRNLTRVGRAVKSIIVGDGNPESSGSYPLGRVPARDSAACARDTCCIWKHVANDMEKAFRGRSGRCNGMARACIRLGFHDAAGWSKSTGPGGGADGSLVLAAEEMSRPDNRGLEDAVAQMKRWHAKYAKYGVGMADLVQMGATVATVVCPLGPRIRSFVGRPDSAEPCTDGLLPGVHDSADRLIRLFEDKTIRAHGLTALIGAHTTSQQRFVAPARAGDPQDSTPGVWDVKFYKQTLGTAPERVFRFDSDVALARDPRIADEFREFAGRGGQEHWNEDYAREYVRLSLLGVRNINGLTECTKVLPAARKAFTSPDQGALDKWLKGKKKNDRVADAVEDGEIITDLVQ